MKKSLIFRHFFFEIKNIMLSWIVHEKGFIIFSLEL